MPDDARRRRTIWAWQFPFCLPDRDKNGVHWECLVGPKLEVVSTESFAILPYELNSDRQSRGTARWRRHWTGLRILPIWVGRYMFTPLSFDDAD